MINVGIVASGPAANLTLDRQELVKQVGNLLQRDDLDTSIEVWLSFVLRELTDEVDFPELRTKLTPAFPLVANTFEYDLVGDLAITDFSRMDSVYYRNTTDAANEWGRNLIPLPTDFYSGDTVDYQKLLDRSVPAVGDPIYYFIKGTKLIVYPALTTGLTATITPTWFRLVSDLTTPTSEPDIDNRWRHYLIWLAFYWGKSMLEQEDPIKPSQWEKKFNTTIDKVKAKVERKENKRIDLSLPSTGLEMADKVY